MAAAAAAGAGAGAPSLIVPALTGLGLEVPLAVLKAARAATPPAPTLHDAETKASSLGAVEKDEKKDEKHKPIPNSKDHQNVHVSACSACASAAHVQARGHGYGQGQGHGQWHGSPAMTDFLAAQLMRLQAQYDELRAEMTALRAAVTADNRAGVATAAVATAAAATANGSAAAAAAVDAKSRAGRTQPGQDWKEDQGLVCIDVETNFCRLDQASFVASLGGQGQQWGVIGAHAVYGATSPTAFRMYIRRPDNDVAATLAAAKSCGWFVNWIAIRL